MSELRRLRELEAENTKLKRMFTDLALENVAIKDVLNRNSDAIGRERGGIRCKPSFNHARLPDCRPSAGGVLQEANASV